jgi:hypothetical protein
MIKTFFQVNNGDIIYYITVEKSVLKNKNEIKTGVVTDVRKTDIPYQMIISLNNGMTFTVENWNCNVIKDSIEGHNDKCSIVEPFYFNMISTDEKELTKRFSELVANTIGRLTQMSVDIQEELVRLSSLKLFASALMVKKAEKIILEPTFI